MTRTMRILFLCFCSLAALIGFAGIAAETRINESQAATKPSPYSTPSKGDYNRPPKIPFDRSDNVFKFDQLAEAYRAPGEYTHRLDGETYGFESLSFIITKTQPNGGPNLHVHDVEEAHVLMEGRAQYQLGEKTFFADAPYVVKVPAGVPHTFVNAGEKAFELVAVFASKKLASRRVGPNPLVKPVQKSRE